MLFKYCVLNGLGIYASAPDSIPSIFSSVVFFAERITKGMCTVCLLLFSCLVRVIPSILGIIISVMMRSGVSCFNTSNPSSPFSAVNIAYSSDNMSFSIHNSSLLSSMIRMVVSGRVFSSSLSVISGCGISALLSGCSSLLTAFCRGLSITSVTSSGGKVTINWVYWFTSLST